MYRKSGSFNFLSEMESYNTIC